MTASSSRIRLYRHALSGHAHRVELMLSLLDLPYERIDVDLGRGAHKAPDYLAKNPWGQVPVLEDGELTLADSNAILLYLASRYDPEGPWLPRDPVTLARLQQWFSVAAGQLAYGPGLLRKAAIFRTPVDEAPARALAKQLFEVLEATTRVTPFLLGAAPSLADVTMYAYVARSNEGGVSLTPYAHVRAWLERIEALPRFVPMPQTVTRHVELQREA